MNSFHQILVVNEEVLKFEFTEIHNPSNPRYFVKVFREDKAVSSFEMKHSYSRWDIVPPAPEWMDGIRLELASVIEKFRNKNKD